jgi:hypothetical protein
VVAPVDMFVPFYRWAVKAIEHKAWCDRELCKAVTAQEEGGQLRTLNLSMTSFGTPDPVDARNRSYGTIQLKYKSFCSSPTDLASMPT